MGGPLLAYIGPGAGIALVGSLFTLVLAIGGALLYLVTLPFRMLWKVFRHWRVYRKARVRRVIVVGLDGLEPTITEQLLSEGALPNLAALRASGTYTRLGTTWPPLSPVAWSSFSTGSNPGKHNIFDFIARTHDYRPTISSVRLRGSKRAVSVGRYVYPIGRPEITALRRSRPFWSVLGEHGVFSAILRVPITFPPDRFKGVQLSAMCVPDLRGTQGMFSFFVEEGSEGSTTDGDVGGDRIRVRRERSSGREEVHGYLRGPANSFQKCGGELRAGFVVTRGGGRADATLLIGQDRVPLFIGRHSDWVRVVFRPAPGVKIHGVCRFVLKRFDPPFEMYCTPLQLDPDKPAMPISHPMVFASYLARAQGTFSTLGLAEDTWSLSENVLSEDAFLEQAYDIHAERETMFFDALRKVRRGAVVCVFDGPDRIQHMFWRFLDDQHPALRPEQRASHRHTIRDMYVRMDGLIGRVVKSLRRGDALFVMSDHGFKPFRRGVDLNAWLRDNGYLVLKDGKRVTTSPYLADVDWTRTRAYAIGLAGIYLNLKGREMHGTVEPGEQATRLVADIRSKLTGLRDAATGEVAIHEAVAGADVYKGPYTENGPDVVVGYNIAYRVSWDAAIGKCGEAVFSDNRKAWSGDHCVHPQLVPGVLFSNRKLDVERPPAIIDLAPTALDLFGIEKPAYMDGRSLAAAERAA